MSTAEEIAKEILYLPVTNGQDKTSIEAGAKLIEAYAEQFKPKWVKVEDELPKEGQIVDIWNGGNQRAKFSRGEFERYVDVSNLDRVMVVLYTNVTHWQPLPEKPTI